MLENQELTRVAAQPAAVIRVAIPRSDMQKVAGPTIHQLYSQLQEQGVAPAGPLFMHHLLLDPENFDVEVGVPVAAPVAASGPMHPGGLPATRVARAIYRGPYEGLVDAWAEFGEWLGTQRVRQGQTLWETYLVGPESSPDPAEWRTQLNRPLLD